MAAHKQIITSAASRPIMGLVYNCPISAYLLSIDAIEDDKHGFIHNPILENEIAEIVSIMLYNDTRVRTLDARAAKHGISRQSPRYALSIAFPETFYYKRVSDDDSVVLIQDGVFISGKLTKLDVSEAIVQAVHVKYGDDITARFLTEAHFILDWYLERRGFSIGLMDMLLSNPEAAKQAITKKIAEIRVQVKAAETNESTTEIEKKYNQMEINSYLSSVLNVGKEMAKGDISGEKNSLGIMVLSGAKGGTNNVAQIAGAIGPQFIEGNLPEKIIPYNRALCYFEGFEKSIESQSFCVHSFSDGLDPDEFIFHMGGSRLGLLDTQMKTADIGALQRRISKVLENDKINYFGGVVNSSGVYTSLSYGEGYACNELMMVKGFKSTGDMYMPFDLRKLSNELNSEFDANPNPSKLTSYEIMEILSVIPSVQAAVSTIADYNLKLIKDAVGKQLTEISVASNKIEKLKAKIYNRCSRAELNAGDPVGFHASEAVSEPVTQTNLNTFHSAGGADVGASTGKSFAEILNITQNRKIPTVDIHMKDMNLSFDEINNVAKAFLAIPLIEILATDMEFMVVREGESLGDRGSFYPKFKEICEATNGSYDNYLSIAINAEVGSTYLRLRLNTYQLFTKRITTKDIANAIDELGGTVSVWSPTYDGIVDIYVQKLTETAATSSQLKKYDSMVKEYYDNIGLDNITNVTCLFLQMFIVPAIRNKVILVKSSVIHNIFNSGFIPRQALPISLFNGTRVVELNTLQLVNGATLDHSGEKEGYWTVWLNKLEIFNSGIPLEKLYSLFSVCFGEESFVKNSEDFIRIFNGKWNNFGKDMKINPIKFAQDLISSTETEFKNNVKQLRNGNPLAQIPQEPDVLKYGKYRYIIGIKSITKTLRKLVSHPKIRAQATYSNSPHEMFEVFGIEAARNCLLKELKNIMIGTGASVNPRHLQIIVDVMVSAGTLMPFTARGSIRQQLGAYSESSFEQALQAFQRAAVSGNIEPVDSVSTSILIGKRCIFGTGIFKVGRGLGEPNLISYSGIGVERNEQSSNVVSENDSGGVQEVDIASLIEQAATAGTRLNEKQKVFKNEFLPPLDGIVFGPKAFPPKNIPIGCFKESLAIV